MGFLTDLGPGPIAVDTAIFIYLIEENRTFLPLVEPLFEAAERGRTQIVTSALTLLEVLVVPLRHENRPLANRYGAILSNSRGIQLVDITREQLKSAAWIRATTRAGTPDALQLAAAMTTGCAVFLTNDRDLPKIPNLRIVQLGFYV